MPLKTTLPLRGPLPLGRGRQCFQSHILSPLPRTLTSSSAAVPGLLSAAVGSGLYVRYASQNMSLKTTLPLRGPLPLGRGRQCFQSHILSPPPRTLSSSSAAVGSGFAVRYAPQNMPLKTTLPLRGPLPLGRGRQCFQSHILSPPPRTLTSSSAAVPGLMFAAVVPGLLSAAIGSGRNVCF